MIDKLNIPLQYKETKKIAYTLFLDSEWWWKEEYDDSDKRILHKSSMDKW